MKHAPTPELLGILSETKGCNKTKTRQFLLLQFMFMKIKNPKITEIENSLKKANTYTARKKTKHFTVDSATLKYMLHLRTAV